MIRVPPGWRIERRERPNFLHGGEVDEVSFVCVETAAEAEGARPRAYLHRADGCWYVAPGPSAGRMGAGEARVRAAALCLAAKEVDWRNDAIAEEAARAGSSSAGPR